MSGRGIPRDSYLSAFMPSMNARRLSLVVPQVFISLFYHLIYSFPSVPIFAPLLGARQCYKGKLQSDNSVSWVPAIKLKRRQLSRQF